MALTLSQQAALARATPCCDVQDNGATIQIIGDQADVMSFLDEIRRTFGYENVGWRTMRGTASVIVTIRVRNDPDEHGESGDREYRPNQGRRDVHDGR